jgi:ferredoxin--NADP+ reductase
MSQWVDGTVVHLRQWTDRLYSLQVEADIPPFKAGQFTRVGLDIGGERVARPYSFVNPPADPRLEFYFITVPDGPLTRELVRLAPGDSVYVASRSSGLLVLDGLPDADCLWMLSTGTAIGPFLSILGDAEVWQRYASVVLVHSVRTSEELTYRDTIDRFTQGHTDRFVYIPMTSREETGFGISGRIPGAIGDGLLEARAALPLSAENSQVMICGNPAMVRDTQAVLESRGLRKNRRREPGHITTEQYWKE